MPDDLYFTSLKPINQILGEWWRDDLGQANADAILGQWLVTLVRRIQANTDSHYVQQRDSISPGWRVTAERALIDHIKDITTVEHWASRLGLTAQTLRRRSKAELGCSAKAWMSRLKLTRATDMMVQENVSIETIAQTCGFTSRNAFSRWFKQQTGVAPSQWINR